MKELLELVQILNRQKTRSINILGENFDEETHLGQLYRGIASGEFTTDEEAAQAISGTDPSDRRYTRLKNELTKRLRNTIFFIDVKRAEFNDYQRAYYTCSKDWASAKILLGREARSAAVKLLRKVYLKAIKYDFTDLVLDTARQLRIHHGLYERNRKKYEEYDNVATKYEQIFNAEMLAEKAYTKFILDYTMGQVDENLLNNEVKESVVKLNQYTAKYDSLRLHQLTALLEIFYYMGIKDYQKTIEVGKRRIDFLESKPFHAKINIVLILQNMITCYTYLQEYEKGKKAAEKCLNILTDGRANWFKTLEHYYLLCMHTGEYKKAYQIVEKAFSHKRFNFLPSSNRENWVLFEAYLHYLQFINELQEDLPGVKKRRFKRSKFINEVNMYTQQERGLKIPIWIIQVLFLLAEKNYDKALTKIDNARRFANRYLKSEETKRSHLFFKMLDKTIKNDFEKVPTEKASKKDFEKIHAHPIDVTLQLHQIEIIPYEELWPLVLKTLD